MKIHGLDAWSKLLWPCFINVLYIDSSHWLHNSKDYRPRLFDNTNSSVAQRRSWSRSLLILMQNVCNYYKSYQKPPELCMHLSHICIYPNQVQGTELGSKWPVCIPRGKSHVFSPACPSFVQKGQGDSAAKSSINNPRANFSNSLSELTMETMLCYI